MTALPPLLTGPRRTLLRWLIGCAVLHATLAVTTALLVGRLAAGTDRLLWPALATVATVAGMGATKYAERVLAERLGQDYVHELRGRLVETTFTGQGGPSLGITIARATNDLSSIRGWVAQGIAPLVAAVPLVIGSVGVLGWLHWELAVATTVPLALLALTLGLVSREAYRRARSLRRRRGRLAARLSDTLHARDGILAAGGTDRELRRIVDDSRRVVDAAVARSRTAGLLQAAALTTAAAMAALVVVAGRTAGIEGGAVATALTIAGVLAAPLGETGRIVEFRQNYRAARRVIGPHLAVPSARPPTSPTRQVRGGRGTVQIRDLCGTGHHWALAARAGDRIHLSGPDAATISDTMRQIVAPGASRGTVMVDGWDHSRLEPRRRRELVGLAARGIPLERGTIARSVRYRRPDLPADRARLALRTVGLDQAVADLPRGERTELRGGGDPLAPADRARLKLARAAIGEPALLLLDHLDSELDEGGRRMLTRVVEDYPGVVVFASDQPEQVCSDFRTVVLG